MDQPTDQPTEETIPLHMLFLEDPPRHDEENDGASGPSRPTGPGWPPVGDDE